MIAARNRPRSQACAAAGVTDSPPATSQIARANPRQPSGAAGRFTTVPFVIAEASAPDLHEGIDPRPVCQGVARNVRLITRICPNGCDLT